mgnify:FL=1|nr:MAG TPA: hypothetical protein [Caudoviricetes sp.]
MTPNEAKSLLDGDAVLYQGRNATFLCLNESGRGAYIDTGRADKHYMMCVTVGDIEKVSA